MVFDRDLRVTILGNAGVGKTTLIRRLKGEDIKAAPAEKTTKIMVEKKKIKLESQKYGGFVEKRRNYNVFAVDTPGDFTLRRQWRVAMKKYKTEGVIFMLDPHQDIATQKTAMEDAYNYFLDSLDINPEKADKRAKEAKPVFYLVVNKIDLLTKESGNDFIAAKDSARAFANKFSETLQVYYRMFPNAFFRENYISVHESSYEEIDSIFEQVKRCLYED
ncbi:MAG: Rab family GTPase [Candidatus Hodarchaeales archaeon]|jgi:small GTP-binding protein